MLLAAVPAGAAPPATEAALVERFLAQGAQQALVASARARSEAAAAVGPYLRNPELSIQREESFGADTEFATTIVGGSISLEIGGRHGLRREAGALGADAVVAEQRGAVIDAVCGLRRQALEARAAVEEAELRAVWQARLDALASDVAKLVEGGEKAAFDLRLLQLQTTAHGRVVGQARALADASAASLSAWVGEPVDPPRGEPAMPASPDAQAAERNPALRALVLQGRAAALDEKRAGRWWVPDLGLYGAWRQDTPAEGDPGAGYEAGLTLALPLADTGVAERTAARAAALVADAERARLERDLTADLAAMHAELARLGGAETPAEDATLLEQAMKRYRAGEAPFGDLLDAFETMEADALGRLEIAARVRALRLGLACRAGVFAEPEIAALVEGALK